MGPLPSLLELAGYRSATMANYRVTYKMDPPGDYGDTLFVVHKEISRYSPQDPHLWLIETKADWVGKKVISVERMD